MIAAIEDDVANYIMKAEIGKTFNAKRSFKDRRSQSAKEGDEEKQAKKKPVRKAVDIGRNDPCHCGSGKKYKNCCGK